MAFSSVSSYVRTWDLSRGAGEVHSVFKTSFNIELAGHLLHVGTTDRPLSCLGAQVDPQEMATLLSRVVQRDRVLVDDARLRIYSRAGVSVLDLAEAPVLDLRMVSAPWDDVLASGADVALQAQIASRDLGARIGLPWPDPSRPVLTELARYAVACVGDTQGACDARSAMRFEAARRGMCSAVAYLVGRGLGLTPSGDDVLCGFGCGLALIAGAGSEGFTLFAREVLAASAGKTTAVSEAYLQAMAAGHANQDYVELGRVMAQGDFGRLGECLDRVLTMGHTSGADSLLGFAAAFGCLI